MPTDFTIAAAARRWPPSSTPFVASVPREDDPDGFYGAKGSDVGADVATERLPAHAPAGGAARGPATADRRRRPRRFKDLPQAAREELITTVAGMSPEAAGAIAALYQLLVMFAYTFRDHRGATRCGSGDCCAEAGIAANVATTATAIPQAQRNINILPAVPRSLARGCPHHSRSQRRTAGP